AFGRVLVRAGGYGLHRRRELGLALLELFLGALQHLEREDLRLLQRAAEILIRGQYELLAVDLVARIARDVEIGPLDLLEPVRDVAAHHLGPDVRKPLPRVDLAVLELVDHRLRVLANAIERVRDLLIALAELHRRDLLADDLIEQRCLRQRACDRDYFRLVEVRHTVEQRDDRCLFRALGNEAEIAEPVHRLVEILHWCGHGDPRFESGLADAVPGRFSGGTDRAYGHAGGESIPRARTESRRSLLCRSVATRLARGGRTHRPDDILVGPKDTASRDRSRCRRVERVDDALRSASGP